MQLEQRFELPVAPNAVWAAFQDIGLLVDCLPGASLTGPAVEGDWPLRFDVKLGPIAAAFAGSGKVGFDAATRSGRFEGQAADKRTQSRVKGAADFNVAPQGNGTLVSVSVDYALSGSLAQFSRGGIVRELASALTAQFAQNLAARLGEAEAAAPASPVAPGIPSDAHGGQPHPDRAAAPLNAFDLLAAAWRVRWRRWLHRLFNRPST